MIGLALGDHLDAHVDAFGLAALDPSVESLGATGLAGAGAIEERDDGFLFGAVVLAESHKAAMAVGAGAAVLERFNFGLEGRFVDDTAAICAQQLFEFEVTGHGSSSST